MVVLAVLGAGVIPADSPLLRADDLGLTRGDGIFETMHVRDGRPWLLDEHLARLHASAERMDLDLPPRAELAELAGQACAAWEPQREGALKMVCTRGPENVDTPTVFATLTEVPAAVLARRDRGVSLKTLCLGYETSARVDTPWLLAGAKTLSYAINMASQRYAQAHGFDDALWVSRDGYALEGPISSLVWHAGDELVTIPAELTGILAGITARFALDHAGELGLTPAERMITPGELATVGGAWMLSSVRGIVAIRALDGVPIKESPENKNLRKLLGF